MCRGCPFCCQRSTMAKHLLHFKTIPPDYPVHVDSGGDRWRHHRGRTTHRGRDKGGVRLLGCRGRGRNVLCPAINNAMNKAKKTPPAFLNGPPDEPVHVDNGGNRWGHRGSNTRLGAVSRVAPVKLPGGRRGGRDPFCPAINNGKTPLAFQNDLPDYSVHVDSGGDRWRHHRGSTTLHPCVPIGRWKQKASSAHGILG